MAEQASSLIPTNGQYPKLSKATSGYAENKMFKNADLSAGYFCHDCAQYTKENQCAIVESHGPDVDGKESGIIAPYGVCTLWHPNEGETR